MYFVTLVVQFQKLICIPQLAIICKEGVMSKPKRILKLSMSLVVGLGCMVFEAPAYSFECISGTTERDSAGNISKCTLANANGFEAVLIPNKPPSYFACQGGQPISFHPKGNVTSCVLERPITVREGNGAEDTCDRGSTFHLTAEGYIRFPNWCN